MKSYTVCTALNKRRDDLWDALNKNNVEKARAIAYECLKDPKITDKVAVQTAMKAFANPNKNHFMSTLATYMTCMKVS